MKIVITCLFLSTVILGCRQRNKLEKHGDHYQQFNDFDNLQKAVALIPLKSDTSFVKLILGEPIVVGGFDYRYLVDSIGPNGCQVGAVFHINEKGKIDQKWIDEICE